MLGNSVKLDTKDKLRLVCKSSRHVKNEHYLILGALYIVILEPDMHTFFSKLLLCHIFLLGVNQMHVVVWHLVLEQYFE